MQQYDLSDLEVYNLGDYKDIHVLYSIGEFDRCSFT
jgi:hypothetical protein